MSSNDIFFDFFTVKYIESNFECPFNFRQTTKPLKAFVVHIVQVKSACNSLAGLFIYRQYISLSRSQHFPKPGIKGQWSAFVKPSMYHGH